MQNSLFTALAATLVLTTAASAAPGTADDAMPQRSQGTDAPAEDVDPSELIGWLEPIPTQCRRYAALPAGARNAERAWNQLVSLAACMQETALDEVTDPEELPAMIDQLVHGLTPTMAIYLVVLEHAPRPVQFRAVYHVGMAHVGLITRARSTLVAPADVDDPAQEARYLALHDELEPLLQEALETAWISFALVVSAAAEDPTLASDRVTQNMVRSAGEMLYALGELEVESTPDSISVAPM